MEILPRLVTSNIDSRHCLMHETLCLSVAMASMLLPQMRLYRSRTVSSLSRSFATIKHASGPRKPRVIDETSIAGAQHKPSLSGPSLGHLLTELSATTPEMVKQGLRKEGETVPEADRTRIRRIAFAMGAIPMVVAGSYLISQFMGWNNNAQDD